MVLPGPPCTAQARPKIALAADFKIWVDTVDRLTRKAVSHETRRGCWPALWGGRQLSTRTTLPNAALIFAKLLGGGRATRFEPFPRIHELASFWAPSQLHEFANELMRFIDSHATAPTPA